MGFLVERSFKNKKPLVKWRQGFRMEKRELKGLFGGRWGGFSFGLFGGRGNGPGLFPGLGLGLDRSGGGALLLEFLDPSRHIYQLDLAGEERMAGGTNLNGKGLALRGSGLDDVSAGANHLRFIVFRVNSSFHATSPIKMFPGPSSQRLLSLLKNLKKSTQEIKGIPSHRDGPSIPLIIGPNTKGDSGAFHSSGPQNAGAVRSSGLICPPSRSDPPF